MKILVTGARGFIGKNLVTQLEQQATDQVLQFDVDSPPHALEEYLDTADIVIHLAGVNRPQTEQEFHTGNVDLTSHLCTYLAERGRAVPLVLSSSIQAALDNPYGISKRGAEEVVKQYARQTGAPVVIYRLPNVFGKWCRPNYNSVVATFCHNIAHNLPITVSDPSRELSLVYVDDVVRLFSSAMQGAPAGLFYGEVAPVHTVTLGRLAELIYSFRQSRENLQAPDFGDEFTRKLYVTYLSYLAADDFAYNLQQKTDNRGSLAEFIKYPGFGQIFVSRTAPGITRGNHYHHTKTEKFLVLEGQAIIRFRHILGEDVIAYPVAGPDYRVVDIPPGYTHSIENVGSTELVTLFWADEIFDANRPDTYALPVLLPKEMARASSEV